MLEVRVVFEAFYNVVKGDCFICADMGVVGQGRAGAQCSVLVELFIDHEVCGEEEAVGFMTEEKMCSWRIVREVVFDVLQQFRWCGVE